MVLAAPHPYYRPMPKSRPAYNQGEPTTALGRFIRAERDRRGWGQEDVAELAGEGMTASEISNIELGRRGLPKPPRMIAIARAFGVHVCDLYVAAGFPEFGAYRGFERRVEENVLAGEDVPTA
jgi:transcriptional regulator with XRE-family HTH domain